MQAPKSRSTPRNPRLDKSVAAQYNVYASENQGLAGMRPFQLTPDLEGEALACDLYNAKGVLLLKSGTVLTPALREQLLGRPMFCQAEHVEMGGFNPLAAMRNVAEELARFDQALQQGERVDGNELVEIAHELYEAWGLDADACLGYARLFQHARPSISHVVHAALIAAELAAASRMPKGEIREIIGGALTMNLSCLELHDIMHASSTRPDAEMEHALFQHPVASRRLLESLGSFGQTWLEVVSHHHENIDGSGYPAGLMAVDIPLGARMVRIADILAARLTGRKTRPPTHWNIYETRSLQLLARHIFGEDIRHLDATLVTQLIHALGRFPPGSLVRLSNNELAVISRRMPAASDTPSQVHAIRDYQGKTLERPRLRRIGQRECTIRNYANEDSVLFPAYDWQAVWGYAA